MENLVEILRTDLETLADEREVAASNEHLWALGASDPDTAAMHETNADTCRQAAELYRRIAGDVLAVFKQYGD